MIKRVLVGMAGKTYTPVAIERAVTLAQSHCAEVTGVSHHRSRRFRRCFRDDSARRPY